MTTSPEAFEGAGETDLAAEEMSRLLYDISEVETDNPGAFARAAEKIEGGLAGLFEKLGLPPAELLNENARPQE